jgi:hypothetical protein
MPENPSKHSIGFHQHLVIPEANHPIPGSIQLFGPQLIVGRLIQVLTAVQLNDQLNFYAGEIRNKARNWILATEFQSTHLSTAEKLPQPSLGIRRVAAQVASMGPDSSHRSTPSQPPP